MYNKLNSIAAEISAYVLERDEAIRGIMIALLSRTNLFLAGPPGTSKTMLVQEINSRITGAEMFEVLLDKFSPPEIVFGPISIQALQKDIYERSISGYAPTAHICFFSEIWKCNDALLNAMLMLVNEHKYKNGKQVIDCPLMTAVGDSNETPAEESSLAAIYDRFALRYVTRYVSDANFVNLLRPTLTRPAAYTTISLDELKKAQHDVLLVNIPDDILEEISALKIAMTKDGFFASDRRWRASIRLLQAAAYLEGRDTVVSDDLMLYSAVLWDEMKQAKPCAQKIGQFINPALTKLLEHIDAIDGLLSIMVKGDSEQERLDAKQKINTHKASIEKLSGRVGKSGERALVNIQTKEKAAIRKIMAL